ncbi:MAG: bifunctional ornithine acetyltransferase/N-acetylglutamate synthase [Candidatus Altiarchaeota archaeon]
MRFQSSTKGICGEGFHASGIRLGKCGVTLILAACPCTAVGVFTKNSVKAAPVVLSKQRIGGRIKAIVANSGNANCCVKGGLDDAKAIGDYASEKLGVPKNSVLVASTGVIGKKLDLGLIEELTKKAAYKLKSNSQASLDAAKAIMTTDTKAKMYAVKSGELFVGAIAKGSGMIHPDMATMLCFITTNAKLPRKQLQSSLNDAVAESFNMVSVDGDQSTNDTVILLSNGFKKCKKDLFQGMLKQVCVEIAKKIAADGEGASKFFEVNVSGARSEKEARIAAKAVESSPLVKTALYGSNPNWGRIAGKIGSVIDARFERMSITFSSKTEKAKVLSKGVGIKSKDSLTLRKAKKILRSKEIVVTVNLGSCKGKATAWGCDLTPEYVKINAEYN